MAKGNITQRERALRAMFDYFLHVLSNSDFPLEELDDRPARTDRTFPSNHPLSECPLEGTKYDHEFSTDTDCNDWCGLLWPELRTGCLFGRTECPCHFFGRATALKELESLLRKEGFIDGKE